jgi:hypothetical protein
LQLNLLSRMVSAKQVEEFILSYSAWTDQKLEEALFGKISVRSFS